MGYSHCYDSSIHAVPELDSECIPTIQAFVNETKELLVPLSQDLEGQDKLSMMLLTMDTCQKYAKDLGKKGVKLRDIAFQKILKGYPSSSIEEAIYEYMNKNPDYPSPAEIKKLAETKKYVLESRLERLEILLEATESGSVVKYLERKNNDK